MSGRIDVRAQLRPTEYLRAKLEGNAVEFEFDGETDPLASKATWPAVVALVARAEGNEESCALFVYRIDESDTPDKSVRLTLQNTYPIYSEFSAGISQPDSDALPTSPTSPSSASQERKLSLDIYDKSRIIFKLHTTFKETLSDLVRLCHAYQGLSDWRDKESFSWLKPYRWNPGSWLSVRPPRDLRHILRPLHEQLSSSYAGMAKDDPADYFLLRNNWLQTQPKAQLLRTAERHSLNIRVGTFNVNDKLPSQDLSAWVSGNLPPPFDSIEDAKRKSFIPPMKEISPLGDLTKVLSEITGSPTSEAFSTNTDDKVVQAPTSSRITVQGTTGDDSFIPDLLVLGFEELDLSAGALVAGVGAAREESWTVAIFASLGEKGEQYEKLASKQLVGMLLIIFVRRGLKSQFAARSGAVGAGLMGVMGNKGAVALRITYQPPPTATAPIPLPIALTFVDAHLAAFDEMLDRRNSDFREISRRLELGPCPEYICPPAEDPARTGPPMLSIYRTDMLIWMGDLNYRLELPSSDIRHVLRNQVVEEAAETLQKFDQLRSAIRAGTAFEDFEEEPITFLPTYRFSHGLAADTLGYDMKRKPAWTDRILHMASKFISLRQLSYTSHPSITFSDHRPVSANFAAEIPTIDAMLLDETANKLLESVADVDPEDLDDMPSFTLDNAIFDLGDVSYDTPIVRVLTVTNAGTVPAAFRFLPRSSDTPVHPAWVSIEPMTGFLLPSEKVEVSFTIRVTRAIAEPFNLRFENVVSTLILHTILGKDHFIMLSGNYLPTCFGNTFSTLARLSKPIRTSAAFTQDEHAIHAPREISSLVSWLLSNSIEHVDDLFVAPGDPALLARIREALDTGNDLPAPSGKEDAHMTRAIGATLLALIASLTEPLMPPSLHTRCAGARDRDTAFGVLASLPPASVNTWLAVTSCLHLFCVSDPGHDGNSSAQAGSDLGRKDEPSEKSDRQLSRSERIAAIWTPVLLPEDPESPAPVSMVDLRRFVMLFVDPS